MPDVAPPKSGSLLWPLAASALSLGLLALLGFFFIFLVPGYERDYAWLKLKLPACAIAVIHVSRWFVKYWYMPVLCGIPFLCTVAAMSVYLNHRATSTLVKWGWFAVIVAVPMGLLAGAWLCLPSPSGHQMWLLEKATNARAQAKFRREQLAHHEDAVTRWTANFNVLLRPADRVVEGELFEFLIDDESLWDGSVLLLNQMDDRLVRMKAIDAPAVASITAALTSTREGPPSKANVLLLLTSPFPRAFDDRESFSQGVERVSKRLRKLPRSAIAEWPACAARSGISLPVVLRTSFRQDELNCADAFSLAMDPRFFDNDEFQPLRFANIVKQIHDDNP